MEDPKNRVHIQSLLVGFSIIDLIAKHGKPIKFNDIHRYTQISKSNLYKYLNTLTSLGVLYRDPKSGFYSLGSALIEYGMAAVNQDDIVQKVTPYLEEINLISKETTLLAVWTYQGPMIIKMIHSRAGLNLGGQVGTILPIQSAGGKLFAAFMEGPLIQDWIKQETRSFTTQEYTRIEQELKTVRKESISFAQEALAPSIASAGIPVFNYNREIIGAVIIVGFQNTIPSHPNHDLSHYLLEKSVEISSQFGFSIK
ncbi:IclR family transcriptional regulator [Bacillus smithii]|jgi:DNA-binding IclR family transcriptional regulator|uniref:IclR family transcriptional regulator n=1 Tax=Bacillus smithii TaxID=1479 RepID=UPI002E20EF60|nr:IclR family transcriptional regulator [Bacillus smithii]MED1457509.1 IclR family transcriptional regulator [Bacillus smithii]